MDAFFEFLMEIYVVCAPIFWFAIPALVMFAFQVFLFRFVRRGIFERGSLFLFVIPVGYILYALIDPAGDFGSWRLIGVVFGLFIGLACYTGYWLACEICGKSLI